MKYYSLEAVGSKNIHNQMVYMVWGEGGATEDQGSPPPPAHISCSILLNEILSWLSYSSGGGFLSNTYSKLMPNALLAALLLLWWFLLLILYETDRIPLWQPLPPSVDVPYSVPIQI